MKEETIAKINMQLASRLSRIEKENEKLKKQIELLKKFNIIGEFINEIRNIRNEG